MLAKRGMFFRTRRVYPQHHRILRLSGRPVVSKFAELLGANRRFVGRIEHQDDVLAAQALQRYDFSILIRKRKRRSVIADFEWIGKQPGKHFISLSDVPGGSYTWHCSPCAIHAKSSVW